MDNSVSLDDKYALTSGRAYINGMQALVLLTLMQRRRDKAAGLNTAGFVSGYRGSPLSGLDQEFIAAARFLDPLDIKFKGGVNESLAATAVWGTQNLHLDSEAIYDGVFAMWYGKGAGLDQCVDVMRHANNAGTAPHGGVLAVVGDDHALKSSSQPHHCEPTFADLRIPVFYPASIAEILSFGLLGYALSRDAGCWVGLKTLPETVNSAAVIDLSAAESSIMLPADLPRGPSRHVQWPDPWPAGERRFYDLKWPRILEFLRLNQVNRVIVQSARPALGVVTTGKSHLDTMEALSLLGLCLDDAAELGISIYKIGVPWPLEPEGMAAFSRWNPRLLVVEEKRPTIEDQIKTLLYGQAAAPVICGRQDEAGRPLLPAQGEIAPEEIAQAIVRQLPPSEARTGLLSRAEDLLAEARRLGRLQPPIQRTPFFCSGCPHNTSTKVPEGSKAMAGIGCHGMAMWAADKRTATHTHMGGEGATWNGHAPFTRTRHMFQNLGEGTYHHSGLLAIRAAISANSNITYKILFNDAVAMTGGQAIDGQLTVPQISQQLHHEGVRRIVVVSEDPARRREAADQFAPGVTFAHRDELDRVQRELREIPGVTALIYDQVCATEKRRRRKRGTMPAADRRVFINDMVCEGCGDCSVKSNCLSVTPIETEFGRKRRIDQSACNSDLSCLKGFCPSFVVVEGGRIQDRGRKIAAQLVGDGSRIPLPRIAAIPADGLYDILCTGIGGTGVVTVGAILGMAARLEGLTSSVHDRLGMAQKFGAVTSHVRIAARHETTFAVRIPVASADLVIGGDLTVTAQPDAIKVIGKGKTRILLNMDPAITAAFVSDPDLDPATERLVANIASAASPDLLDKLAATRIAAHLTGDTIGANMLMLGFAFQRGLIPISYEALVRAIEINGVAVEATIRTFNLGRLAAHDGESVRQAMEPLMPDHAREKPATALPEIVARRKAFLTDYQNAAYAERYLELVEKVRAREAAISPGSERLTRAVAKNYFKLLAYKDEYEVARLYASDAFKARLSADFAETGKLSFYLAPPLLARRDPVTGEPRKIRFGAWILPAFSLLARLKFLRGTAFDPFGRSGDRRLERKLIADYEQLVDDLLHRVTSDNLDAAEALLSLAEQIRGYGPVKERHYRQALVKQEKLLAEINGARQTGAAA